MNLEFGSEYDEFTSEVEAFCIEYSGATITTNDKKFEMHDALSGNVSSSKGKSVGRSEWQKILIEKEKEIIQIWINSTILPLLWMAMVGGERKEIKVETTAILKV